jgi:hypothetical protein
MQQPARVLIEIPSGHAGRGSRGRPKRGRAELLRLEHPGLDWDADRGLDMADAIGIGQWHLDCEPRRHEASGGQP